MLVFLYFCTEGNLLFATINKFPNCGVWDNCYYSNLYRKPGKLLYYLFTSGGMMCLTNPGIIGFDDAFYFKSYEDHRIGSKKPNLGFLYFSQTEILPKELKQIINAYIMILFVEEKEWLAFFGSRETIRINERWFFSDVYKIINPEEDAKETLKTKPWKRRN